MSLLVMPLVALVWLLREAPTLVVFAMEAIRVLVVDDQAIIRQRLATILKYAPGIEVVGQAGDGEEALALVRALRPDVVLMDLDASPGGFWLRGESFPSKTQVVILTAYDTDDLVFEGIKAGARGIFSKMPARVSSSTLSAA